VKQALFAFLHPEVRANGASRRMSGQRKSVFPISDHIFQIG
jgi:hypothetical protein